MAENVRNKIFEQNYSYKLREYRSKLLKKSEEVVDRGWLGWAFTLIFMGIDTACLYTVFNSIQTEAFYIILLLSFGCGICLDAPLAYAGNYLKGYFQKLHDLKSTVIIITLAVMCFLIAFSGALWFRIETDELTFQVSDTSTLTNTATQLNTATQIDPETAERNERVVFVAALFFGILPLCTSLASFLITFYTANPLAARIKKYDKALFSIDAQITDLKLAIHEASKLKEHRESLVARERDLYDVFCQSCDSQGRERKKAIRHALMQITQDANHINRLSESAKAVSTQPDVPIVDISTLKSYPKTANQ